MRLLLSAALLALTASTAHGQTVGGNACGVLPSSPLVAVDETPFVALPASGGVMHSTLAREHRPRPRRPDAEVHVLLTTPRPDRT
jgi:hypothetical protein